MAEGIDVTEGTGVTEGVECFFRNTSHYLTEGIDVTEGTDVTEGDGVTEGTNKKNCSQRAQGPIWTKKVIF